MMIGQKKLMNKTIIEHRMDLINCLYIIFLEICKLNSRSKKLARKIRIVNIYDNRVEKGCTWDGDIFGP